MKLTSQEIELFERRHENGYDLTIDSRYMLWLNSAHPEEADRLCSKNLQSTVEETVNNEVGGKRNGSRNEEELTGVDQCKKLLSNSKSKVSSSTRSTGKKGRNALEPLRTIRSATLKQRSTQTREEQAGRSTSKIGGSRVKKADGSTTISSRSGRVTRSQMAQNSKKAKSSDVSKPRKKL